MKKAASIALLLVIGVGLWYFIFRGNSKKSHPSRGSFILPTTATVERRTILQTVLVSGDIAPAVSVEVKAEISGRIKRIAKTIGDAVKKNDLLVELDDRDLLTEKASAQTDIEGTRFSLEKSKRLYERSQKLFDRKLISLETFENTKTDYDVAQNNFEKAGSRMRTVLDKLEKTRIPAPMDGTILTLPVVEGQVVIGAGSVNSGTLLMNMADLTHMVIYSHVNQVDIAQIKSHQKVDFRVDSIREKKMPAVVSLISPIATSKNNIKGFAVTLDVKEIDPRLRPGMTADVTFPILEVENTLALPLNAIFTDENDNKIVYRPSKDPNEEPEKVPVVLGVVTYDYAEIKSGLKQGDLVLLVKPEELPKK